MIIAQVSDLHVKSGGALTFGRVDTARCLSRCVDHLNRLEPPVDIVVITGDTTDDGLAEEYQTVRRELSRLESPYFLIPGNHDDRTRMRETFQFLWPVPLADEFVNYTIEDYPVRLIALDTTVPKRARGLVCERRLRWLASELDKEPTRPTIVLMHHPPFATGIGFMDRIGFDGVEELGEIVARHPQIERILCGHMHRPIQVRWNGTIAATAPGVAHQFMLGLSSSAPPRWVAEPPAVLLHLWRPETGLVSHMSYIEDFGDPQPFD